MSNHAERVARFWGLPVPAGIKHGQKTVAKMYYGCDCKACLPSGRRNRPRGQRKPAVQRDAELRANKAGKPVPPGVKHGVYAYRVYRCRCADCKAAHNAQRAAGRRRWQDTARGHWVDREDGVTELHWPPDDGEPWLCPVCEFKRIPE